MELKAESIHDALFLHAHELACSHSNDTTIMDLCTLFFDWSKPVLSAAGLVPMTQTWRPTCESSPVSQLAHALPNDLAKALAIFLRNIPVSPEEHQPRNLLSSPMPHSVMASLYILRDYAGGNFDLKDPSCPAWQPYVYRMAHAWKDTDLLRHVAQTGWRWIFYKDGIQRAHPLNFASFASSPVPLVYYALSHCIGTTLSPGVIQHSVEGMPKHDDAWPGRDVAYLYYVTKGKNFQKERDGGCLRIYGNGSDAPPTECIAPRHNTLLRWNMKPNALIHDVEPSRRKDRYTLVGFTALNPKL